MKFFTRQVRSLLLLSAVITLIGSPAPRAQGLQDTTWFCGDSKNAGGVQSVWATLNRNDGTFTIGGTGRMRDAGSVLNPWYNYRNSIASVIIEPGVTHIGSGTFFECTWLTEVTIPGTVTSIADQVFYRCTRLTKVVIHDGITEIGSLAFGSCNNLTSITTPNGQNSVTIPNGVTTIKMSTFGGCGSLTGKLVIPDGVTEIEPQAFSGCGGLTEIVIPDGVTKLGMSAFDKCSGLTEITIPNSVTAIQSMTFNECTALKSIIIPNGVTAIQTGTFNGCTALSDVTIPISVTAINSSAFFGCTALKTIEIPAGMLTIGDGAFHGAGLVAVRCLKPLPPTISSVTFSNTANNICLYVPDGSVDRYKTANYWTDFSCVKTIGEYDPATISITAKDRVIPAANPGAGAAAVAPVNRLAAEFTAGPNPASGQRGAVNFFRYGSRIENAALSIYNSSGDTAGKVVITDNSPAGGNGGRQVGSWDLRDGKGRPVPEGTYLVKGVLKTSGGKTERVSLTVGVVR